APYSARRGPRRRAQTWRSFFIAPCALREAHGWGTSLGQSTCFGKRQVERHSGKGYLFLLFCLHISDERGVGGCDNAWDGRVSRFATAFLNNPG
ncbi:MAG: hypothetical protein ABI945_00285, partial [Nitrospirales bacterium]